MPSVRGGEMRENVKDSRVRPCHCCSRAACVGPPGRLEASELVFVLANISSALLTIAVTLLADNKQVTSYLSSCRDVKSEIIKW